MRDRKPGQKPKPPTDRFQGAVKTTAKPKTKITPSQPKKKVLGGRGKVTEKPGARAAAAAASDSARRTYPRKTKINGMMAPKKPKEESGTVMSGRPEDLKSRDIAADKRHFAISRGGTQDDPNRGFRRRLFGKNVSEAEAKKDMEEAYKREQEDRKRAGQSDHYQYGTGRRSQLKGKQGVKKGGVVAKSKGGMVRFSTGGRVLDTYDYN